MTLQPMLPQHLSAAAALERLCFSLPWSLESFAAELENPSSYYVVVVEGDRLLGYAGMRFVLDEFYVDNIAVAPDCRRRGVADALLSALTAFGRARLACLMLEVRASNGPAIALYEKHGFQAVGRRKNYYDAPREDAILMTLKFGPDTGRTMCAPTDGGSYETAPAEQRGACRPL